MPPPLTETTFQGFDLAPDCLVLRQGLIDSRPGGFLFGELPVQRFDGLRNRADNAFNLADDQDRRRRIGDVQPQTGDDPLGDRGDPLEARPQARDLVAALHDPPKIVDIAVVRQLRPAKRDQGGLAGFVELAEGFLPGPRAVDHLGLVRCTENVLR